MTNILYVEVLDEVIQSSHDKRWTGRQTDYPPASMDISLHCRVALVHTYDIGYIYGVRLSEY